MQSYVGNKKLLAMLLAALFMGNAATVVAENDPVTDTSVIEEEVSPETTECDSKCGDGGCDFENCKGFQEAADYLKDENLVSYIEENKSIDESPEGADLEKLYDMLSKINSCNCEQTSNLNAELLRRLEEANDPLITREGADLDKLYDMLSKINSCNCEQTSNLNAELLRRLEEANDSLITREIFVPKATNTELNVLNNSLVDRYPELFSRKNICTIDTVGDPDATHVKLFNPELSQIHTFSLDKDPKHKDRGMWEVKVGCTSVPGIKVIRHTKRVFGARIKFDKKFVGYRKTAIGKFLENLFGITRTYRGTLLTDQYKNYPLWNIVLRDRAELHKFIGYLSSQNRRHRGTPFFDQKPILRLTLESDPFLRTLELEDIALINTQFQLVDMHDAKATNFFNTTITKMDRILLDFEASHPIKLGDNVREQFFNAFESYFKDFDRTDMVATGIISASAMFAAYIAWKKLVSPLADEWIPEVTKTKWYKYFFPKPPTAPTLVRIVK